VKVSVVIATKDRAEKLEGTLDSLARLDPPAGGWELLVVDDGSTDATPTVLRERLGRPDLPLSVVPRTGRGKPAALNAAIESCRGEIVALTDDDCLPAEDWLTEMAREFEEDPGLAALGGRVELYDPSHGNVATRTSMERTLLASATQLYGFAIGANMAFRRSVLVELGLFDPLVGPGAPVPSGNDIDILYRAFRAGHRVVYTPAPVVYHNHGRVDEGSLEKVRRRYVVGRGAFYAKFGIRGDRAVLRMAAREVVRSLRKLASQAASGKGGGRQIRTLGGLLRGGWLWSRHAALGRSRGGRLPPTRSDRS
jgi:hypothetical protein